MDVDVYTGSLRELGGMLLCTTICGWACIPWPVLSFRPRWATHAPPTTLPLFPAVALMGLIANTMLPLSDVRGCRPPTFIRSSLQTPSHR